MPLNFDNIISIKEVKEVCKKLGIRDWTESKNLKVNTEEAQKILPYVNPKKLKASAELFRSGLEVELEHGIKFPDTNITNNHPILTGKIVMVHLKETLDYYKRLEDIELQEREIIMTNEKIAKMVAGSKIVESDKSKEVKIQLLNFIEKEATLYEAMAFILDGEMIKLDEEAIKILKKRLLLPENKNMLIKKFKKLKRKNK